MKHTLDLASAKYSIVMPETAGWKYLFEAGEILNIKVGDKTLMCAYDQKRSVSIVALADSNDPVRRWSDIFVRQCGCESGSAIGDWRFKLVGPEAFTRFFAMWLSTAGALKITRHTPENRDVEAVYYADSGRLRLMEAVDREPKGRTRRVLVVDDSRTIRTLLKKILSEDPGLEVVGETGDPREVAYLVLALKPDVVTLDINMPEIDGITLLKQLVERFDLPAVMVSSVSFEEASEVLMALELGAVDYIEKPQLSEIDTIADEIRSKVKAASYAVLQRRHEPLALPAQLAAMGQARKDPVLVGASTGGVEAICKILSVLPRTVPPILVAQHIPEIFSRALADRLSELCAFEVREARQGDLLVPGRALIVPGGSQAVLTRTEGGCAVRLSKRRPDDTYCPSIDLLFGSAAAACGAGAMGILLTGMGDDGARGLLEMRSCGAYTVAQDRLTSVVFGMPKVAAQLNAAVEILRLDAVAESIVTWSAGLSALEPTG